MADNTRPDLIFLGVAERASVVHDLGTVVLKWNLLGVKNVLLVNFLPISLSQLNLIFAVRLQDSDTPIKIRLVDDDGLELGWMTIKTGVANLNEPLSQTLGESRALTLMIPQHGYTIAAFSFGQATIIANKPGRYRIFASISDNDELAGEFDIAIIEPAPLTPERIAAIKSDPGAAKAARAELGCKYCKANVRFYVALDQNQKTENEGYRWYTTIPDHFRCDCGKTTIDLTSAKRNFFAILGHRSYRNESALFEPLYHQGILDNLRIEFIKVLEKLPGEEVIQKFIQDNPLLLHQFPSEKIFFKPPILTKFKADFCIVTPQKELVLVEIEKAGTKLLKKDGGEAAEFRHAIDQITSWLHVVDEHRLAVLDSLGIPRESVSLIRGVVIAGRDKGYDAEHLRRLKGVDRGRISLLTYDDIAFGLASLARKMNAA